MSIERSNVYIVSNVYTRNDTPLHRDKDGRLSQDTIDFNRHIQGREGIRIMLRAIYCEDIGMDEIDHKIAWLTKEQKAEYKCLRCPRCSRMDFGWVRNQQGEMCWQQRTCSCMRTDGEE